MQKIKKELEQVCKAFELGKLLSWELTTEKVAGLQTVVFNTEKENNLKYHYKLK